jgi:hypothetical protein
MNALDPAGPQAGAIAWLWWLFLGITTVAFVITLAFFLYSLFRRRDERDAAPDAAR